MLDSKIIKALGVAVREQRRNLGLSQESLAELAGVHRTYIGMIERGEKNITLSNLVKMANALGLSPSDLLRLAEERI